MTLPVDEAHVAEPLGIMLLEHRRERLRGDRIGLPEVDDHGPGEGLPVAPYHHLGGVVQRVLRIQHGDGHGESRQHPHR